MKFRQGFVTNSSSSSFVVATTNSGGEAFLDLLRLINDKSTGFVENIKTVFPEEAVACGDWSENYYPAAYKRAEELKSKNVYEIELESNEIAEILKKADKYLCGFEFICGEYY